MPGIIFDIETVGRDFKNLDGPTQEYLLRYAETEDEKKEVKELFLSIAEKLGHKKFNKKKKNILAIMFNLQIKNICDL